MKTCACGCSYSDIPEDAQMWVDEGELVGWIWNCECGQRFL
jgi:hypothetical protein